MLVINLIFIQFYVCITSFLSLVKGLVFKTFLALKAKDDSRVDQNEWFGKNKTRAAVGRCRDFCSVLFVVLVSVLGMF